MSRRQQPNLTTKLASALLALGHIPYADAKQMTATQLLSLYHFDHGILHAIEINNDFWNLTPRLIAPHREKSKTDAGIVAKARRIERENKRPPAAGQPIERTPQKRKGQPIRSAGFRKGGPKQKIPSRGFGR